MFWISLPGKGLRILASYLGQSPTARSWGAKTIKNPAVTNWIKKTFAALIMRGR